MVGIVYLFVPRWRLVGAGVLTSLAAGFLIMFGVCAVSSN